MSFSFKKRTPDKIIPGTKTSLHNGQLITSCGNPSLDHILGGGLPMGSLMLIEEDKFVTYSKVLVKYFLAEGIFSKQSIFYGSLDDEPQEFIKKLPVPICQQHPIDETKNQLHKKSLPSEDNKDGADLRIAWRYNELPRVNSEQSVNNIGHHFNLTEQIDDETIKNSNIEYWQFTEPTNSEHEFFENQMYFDFLEKLQSIVKCNKKFACQENDEEKSVLRICISSLGSPLWYNDNFEKDFIKFLTILKSIVKNLSAVCLVTVPIKILKILDQMLIAQIRNLVDYSFELESFAGSDKETNPIFKEYNGIFHIVKLNALNSLAAYCPETTDLAFKLRRKKFIIEKLHLPPELQEAENTDDIVTSLSCGSATKNLLEF